MSEICSTLTTKTPVLLTLNRFHTLSMFFHCWFWARWCFEVVEVFPFVYTKLVCMKQARFQQTFNYKVVIAIVVCAILANIFFVSHIFALFQSPNGSWIKVQNMRNSKLYFPYCTTHRATTTVYFKISHIKRTKN